MKDVRLLILSVLAVVLIACGGNTQPQKQQGVAFNPGASPEQKTDADREAKLAAKRDAFNAAQDPMENLTAFEGKVKLTVMIPNEDLSDAEARLLENKLIQMVSMNGIGGLGGDPRYVLAPEVSLLKHEVTSTAPVRHLVTYDITFYVADIILGTVFASSNVRATGVGDSEQLAFIAAFKDLDPTDTGFQKMLETAQTKIIEFYQQHGGDIIKEAKLMAARGDVAKAMAMLGAIPVEAGACYEQAIPLMDAMRMKYLEDECNIVLSQFLAALGNQMNGVNKEAMAYYAMIPANSPCKQEANEALNAYKAHLSAEDARQWERESDQIRADNEYQALCEELNAKVQISGNECLMDAYKSQAAYNRLPWIRKVFHLGSYDPFDGHSAKRDC